MPDAPSSNDPTSQVPKPATPAVPKPWTPIAVVLPVKLRETQIEAVKNLKPPGNPKPSLLEIAKQTALDLIDDFPDATGLEVKIELNGGSAHQLMVIVIPHTL